MTTSTAHATLPLAHGRWALDSDHTTVGFTIRHLGVAKVRGRFGAVSAELVIGPTLEDSTVTASVDLARSTRATKGAMRTCARPNSSM